MRKTLSKVLVFFVCFSLIASMFAGCSQKAAETKKADVPSAGAASTAAAGTEPLTLPIVREPMKFTFWADIGKAAGALKTLNDNLAYQEMEKRTGIKLEFLHPPVGSAKEQFNLLIASRQLPDLIQYEWLTVPGGPGAYIKDKVIIPLNEPVKKWAPNLQKVLEENPTLRKEQEMDDGTYYNLPAFYGDRELAVFGGPILRGDWFKKMNMEVPTTLDEWTVMLRKVKDMDLNGNGQKDEIPLHFVGKMRIDDMPAFIGAWDIRSVFYNNKGKAAFGPVDPKYKEFLQLMNSWYKEGLLDPESLVSTDKIQDEKYTADKVFAILGSMGSQITRYTAMMKPKNPNFQMLPVPYPTLKKGDVPTTGQSSYSYNKGGVAITTACKNVREATKFLDYGYSPEGNILANWGVEGKTYTMVNGKPKYTDLIINNPEGLSREQSMAKYTIWQSTTSVAKYKDVLNERDSLPEQIEGRKQWMLCKNENLLPPLTPTQEESKELATIMNEINTYTNEMFNQFISGKAPLSDFDKYVGTLKSMGLDRATELMQKQLDRYSKRP